MTVPVLITISLLFFLSSCARAQEKCGLAKDLMVQALERVRPGAASAEFEDSIALLKHAVEVCPALGDAWYYRSLFEKRLKHQSQSDYSLRKAQFVGSEAMTVAIDPFALASETDQNGSQPAGPMRDKWALVIGIGKFQDKTIAPLNFTTKDARDFAALLQNKAYGRFRSDHVHLLLDEQASTKNIKAELNWIARNAGRDDLALIYLTSHGSPREADVGVGELNYVITHDTETDGEDSLYSTALPMIDLVNAVKTRIKARRAVVLLDTCHSGGAMTGEKGIKVAPTVAPATSPSPQILENLSQGAGRVIIASSQVKESSFESPKLKNGYFTYFLIRALQGNKGLDPIDKVYVAVKDQVSRAVLTEVHAHQNPVMSRSEPVADIIIGFDTGSSRSDNFAPLSDLASRVYFEQVTNEPTF